MPCGWLAHVHTPICVLALQVWSDLDPSASGFISALQLSTLLAEVAPPLGVRNEGDTALKIQAVILSTDIPLHSDRVCVRAMLHALHRCAAVLVLLPRPCSVLDVHMPALLRHTYAHARAVCT